MILRFLIASLLSVASLTSAAPRPFNYRPTAQHVEKRQSGSSADPNTPFAITGVLTGGISQRLELRQLAANTDQFNIFMLGLQAMQAQSEDDFLSYYQISAIHGAPATAWNGVNGIPAADHGQFYPGYCAHQSNLFLPWHRPYLALYEASLTSFCVCC
jgi:tyrosinase